MTMEHHSVVKLFEVIEMPINVYLIMEHMGGGGLLQHIAEVMSLQE